MAIVFNCQARISPQPFLEQIRSPEILGWTSDGSILLTKVGTAYTETKDGLMTQGRVKQNLSLGAPGRKH